MNNTTYSLKKSEIESKWYIIDAANKPLGRVASEAAKLLRAKSPEKMMMLAIKGMLPKNSLGRQMLKKVRVYAGNEHENIAQKPEVWNF